MLNTAGRSVIQLCHQCRDDPQVQALDYEDKYKRAMLSLKHHVVLDKEGKAILMGSEYDAGDAHEFIGLRLPEELYFYISRAMLSPRVANWLTSGEIDLTLPVGCEDTESYRHLLGDQLTGLQTQTICLLSSSMNRFYQSRSIKIKTWYWRETQKSINVKEEPSVKDKIASWRVPESALVQHFQGSWVRICNLSWTVTLITMTGRPGQLCTLYGSSEQPEMSRGHHCQRQLSTSEVEVRDSLQRHGSFLAAPRIRE